MHSLTYPDGWRLAVGMRWECDAETLARMGIANLIRIE